MYNEYFYQILFSFNRIRGLFSHFLIARRHNHTFDRNVILAPSISCFYKGPEANDISMCHLHPYVATKHIADPRVYVSVHTRTELEGDRRKRW